MFIKDKIEEYNHKNRAEHPFRFEYTAELLNRKGINVQAIIEKIKAFQIAIPSWALGTGGTRFGRFPIGGEPRHLEEKI